MHDSDTCCRISTRAKVFLAQARRFVADATADGVSGAGRQLLLYQACVAACDAGLRAAGYTVEGSEGGHALRFDATAEHLGLDEDLLRAFARCARSARWLGLRSGCRLRRTSCENGGHRRPP